MVKTLKRGDPDSCNRTMTEEKACKGKPKRNIGICLKRYELPLDTDGLKESLNNSFLFFSYFLFF